MTRLAMMPRLKRSVLKRADAVMSAVGMPGRLPVCAEFDRAYRRWNTDRGDQTLRLDYDLSADDIVFDVGGYQGEWAAAMHGRYGCRVHVFEPLPQYYQQIQNRFADVPAVDVHAFGLSGRDQTISLGVLDDATSQFKTAEDSVACELRSISRFIETHRIEQVALLKLNIEGGEYELLEHLIDSGLISRFRDIQVQFHWFVPGAHRRMQRLHQKLQQSHRPTYQYRFVWENWTRMAG
ncbi:FkbM family methyltransferase [Roseimaritima sediminicola]|uniref:FkbM family methyltransferase n=1 Tax=Roseimaritima sediminicola TaxID=2662066 RepID=UPI00129834EE|nr:FkbM family methyltransferase [Roseimaritima sediminicola]